MEVIRSTNISMITKKRKELIIATNINIHMIIVTGKNILLMILLLKMNFKKRKAFKKNIKMHCSLLRLMLLSFWPHLLKMNFQKKIQKT